MDDCCVALLWEKANGFVSEVFAPNENGELLSFATEAKENGVEPAVVAPPKPNAGVFFGDASVPDPLPVLSVPGTEEATEAKEKGLALVLFVAPNEKEPVPALLLEVEPKEKGDGLVELLFADVASAPNPEEVPPNGDDPKPNGAGGLTMSI